MVRRLMTTALAGTLLLAGCASTDQASVVTVTESVFVTVTVTAGAEDAPAEPASVVVPTPTPAGQIGFVTAVDPPDLPAGEPGALSIVAQGPLVGGSQLFVLKNNTEGTLNGPGVEAVAMDADGVIIDTGMAVFGPDVVPPGGLAFGSVYFREDAVTEANITYSVESDDMAFSVWTYVKISEVEKVGDTIRGQIVNDTAEPVEGIVGIGVEVLCLSDDGTPTGTFTGRAGAETLPVGAKAAFEVDTDGGCNRYLIAARG